jgi:cation transport ATPase
VDELDPVVVPGGEGPSPPVIAAAAMALSPVSVIVTALRLRTQRLA